MLKIYRLTRLYSVCYKRGDLLGSVSVDYRRFSSDLTHTFTTIQSKAKTGTMASKALGTIKSFIPSSSNNNNQITHDPVTSPQSWKSTLQSTKSSDIPETYDLLKVLVFKPKTAKTATPVPVVVIAGEETETNASALGKKLGLKEMRLANGDLLTEFFGVDKDSREHFSYLLFGVI